MAQTKKRAAPKRSSKSQAKARGSTSKSKSSSAKSRSSSSKSRPASKRRSTAAKSRSSNGASAPLDSARHAVEGKARAPEPAKDAGQTVGKVASKAKVPLIAGGAALAGAAGGLALAASRQDRHRRLAAAMAMRKPRIKLNSHDVARAAKQVGSFSTQVGERGGRAAAQPRIGPRQQRQQAPLANRGRALRADLEALSA